MTNTADYTLDRDCECPKCGRLHRNLQAGRPPGALSYDDLCQLSVMVQRHMDLSINQPGYRINEWLKPQLVAR